MKRSFDGLLERPAFVLAIAWTAVLVTAGLTYVAYASLVLRQHGTASFAAIGAVMTGFFASRYFRDARLLRRREADEPKA